MKRVVVAAGFILAGLLFLFLPALDAGCGSDTGRVGLCYSGAQLLTGEPDVELRAGDPFDTEQKSFSRLDLILTVNTGEVAEFFADEFALSGVFNTFALITLLCCVAGALTALAPNAKLRAIAWPTLAAAALATLIAAVVTARDALTSAIEPFTLLFTDGSAVVPYGESPVGSGLGCWLAAAALVLALLAVVLRSPSHDTPVFD